MKATSLAIIPARGGSKRIPRKNIREFCGKPMIAWTIEALISSNLYSDIIVSTDDSEIATIAHKSGASIPFIRPPELSGDHIGLFPVIRHALEWLESQNKTPDHLTCCYATAPFISDQDLKEAHKQLTNDPSADYVLAVATFAYPIQRALVSNRNGYLEFANRMFEQTRTQDIQQTFHDAGHFIVGKPEAFMRHSSTVDGNTLACLIPRIRCQDIDTEEDWEYAVQLMTFFQQKRNDSLA